MENNEKLKDSIGNKYLYIFVTRQLVAKPSYAFTNGMKILKINTHYEIILFALSSLLDVHFLDSWQNHLNIFFGKNIIDTPKIYINKYIDMYFAPFSRYFSNESINSRY